MRVKVTTIAGVHGINCLERHDEDGRYASDDEAQARVVACLLACEGVPNDVLHAWRREVEPLVESIRMNDNEFFVQRVADAHSEADAQRIAACLNACEGVPTEVLNDVNSSERELLHHYVEASKQLGECSGGFETLTKEVAALKDENQKLRDTLANPFITGVNIGNGSLEVGFEGAGAQLMAGMFEGQLDDPRAVNFIEARFISPKHGEVIVTAQKLSGKSPTQKLAVAEAALSEALAALRALTDWCRDHTSPTQANTPHALVVTAYEVLLKHGAQ